MRVVLLADIHGNLAALEAVTARLEQLQPDHVLVNGDVINSVPFSPAVIDFVRAHGWTVVRGNHEFYYLDFGSERAQPDVHNAERWGMLHWLTEQISPAQGAWLAMLPDDLTLYFPGTQPLRITHGLPGRNRFGFLQRHTDLEIAQELGAVGERTLISAHTHVQIDRHVQLAGETPVLRLSEAQSLAQIKPARRWHVINPGSVGLPINGDVAAQFAVLDAVAESEVPGGWRATMVRVNYDRRPMLAAYESSGMLAAGGVIATLFYWELVTAEPEVTHYFRWCHRNGHNPDAEIKQSFCRYAEATGRAEYVRQRDPLNV